jgi:hypothetical protein
MNELGGMYSDFDTLSAVNNKISKISRILKYKLFNILEISRYLTISFLKIQQRFRRKQRN